ncbi:dienelactone hydrolase family protein [uncultured Phenylobacterium sp.]|uniref:dienelactone hydrolase family protein n=1 Tax=uncultured Phenylobacterium sp. TaxID=349273 RepID=UPI0025F0112F|nr:dienelactone hydrolase family protein [uncultured Phenylobacterium sp.]
MTVKTETVTYDADGLSMVSHFYCDDAKSGPRPGVLVFPEAFGLGDHAKGRAERLAGLGYAALACDLHGQGASIGMDKLMAVLGPLMQDPTRTRARAKGGLDALVARPEVDGARVAAIGYCFGGTMSFELARSGAPIVASVGFHSGLGTAKPEDAKNIKGKVLACIGADDPGVDPAQRTAFEAEMREAKVDWQLHLYGGVVHSFTNPEADKMGRPEFAKYDARADARSWAEMIGLFDEVFA